jgi:hypothetical protein
VESNLWVKVALMHLEGPVARWFQSAERCLCQIDWGEFCSVLHERFGRDQHEALIRKFFPYSSNFFSNCLCGSVFCSS